MARLFGFCEGHVPAGRVGAGTAEAGAPGTRTGTEPANRRLAPGTRTGTEPADRRLAPEPAPASSVPVPFGRAARVVDASAER